MPTFNKNQKVLVTLEVKDINGQIDTTSTITFNTNTNVLTVEPTANPREFYLVGQAPGSTAATFTSAQGKTTQVLVDVTAAPDASSISVVSVSAPMPKF